MSKTTLYLPIEVKRREYESQAMLAVNAVKAGYRVVLGSHEAIFRYLEHKSSKSGIYLDKSVPRSDRLSWLKNKCEEIWVLDAEISPIHGTDFLKRELPARVNKTSLDSLDKFLVVGEVSKEVLNSVFPDSFSKIVVSGWPRLDLCGSSGEAIYEESRLKILKRYPEFLLFATSFGVNQKPTTLLNQKRAEFLQETPFWSNQLNQEKYSNFCKAVALLIEWDKDEDIPPIVVRPHVTESIRTWRNHLRNTTKTFVEGAGSAIPWLMASRALIHQGSTLAIEAFLKGKDCFLMQECKLDGYGESSDYASEYICSKSSPPQILMHGFRPQRNPNYRPEIIKKYVYNTSYESIPTIIAEMSKGDYSNYSLPSRSKIIGGQLRPRSLRRIFGLIKHEVLWLFNRINLHPLSVSMPFGLDKKTINRVLEASGTKEQVKIRRLTLNLWEFDLSLKPGKQD